MAITYSFDQVKKKATDNNLNMSDADWELASRDPNKGMSLVNSKIGFLGATTEEEKGYWHDYAEGIRKGEGYMGGVDGSQYLQYLPTPDSFAYESAPTYTSQYAGGNRQTYDDIKNYGSFTYDVEKPVYEDTYAGKREELIDAIINHGNFSYDHKADPNYQAYAKQYRREGERASADALAQAAANTGGVASTAAVTAAQQANNYYASQLSDKLPELYDAAYDRWLNEFTLKQNKLAAVQGESASEYDKHLNDVAQWERDRGFALDRYNDGYDKLVDALQYGMALDDSDYAKYLDALSQYNTDKNFAYGQMLDAIDHNQNVNNTRYDRALDAFTTVGDTSLLEAEGVDTSWYKDQLAKQDEQTTKLAEQELLSPMGGTPGGDTIEETLRSRAKYIKAMLAASNNEDTEHLKDLSEDDIVAMLGRGYTGFDALFPYYGSDGPTQTPLLDANGASGAAQAAIMGVNRIAEANNTELADAHARKVIDYYEAYNGIIPEEEWLSAKANGVNAYPFTEYQTYADYVNAYNEYNQTLN